MVAKRVVTSAAFAVFTFLLVGCSSPKPIIVDNVAYMPEESAKQYLSKYLPNGWVDQPWFEGGGTDSCEGKKFPGKLSEIGSITYVPYNQHIPGSPLAYIRKAGGSMSWCGRQIKINNVSESEAINIYKALKSLGAAEAEYRVWDH